MTDDMFNHMVKDVEIIKSLGIDTDEEWSLWQYIDFKAEDLLEKCYQDKYGKKMDFALSDRASLSLKTHIFDGKNRGEIPDPSLLRNYDNVCLLIIEWIDVNMGGGINDYIKESATKLGYPMELDSRFPKPEYNVDKWINVMGNIYRAMATHGVDKDTAFHSATQEWDDKEKEKFKDWMKYYESGEHKKWNVSAELEPEIVKEAIDFKLPDYKTVEDLIANFHRLKKSLIGRVHSSLKLLDKFRQYIDSDKFQKLKECLMSLISTLYDLTEPKDAVGVATSMKIMEDSFIRVANICTNYGWKEGALEFGLIIKESFNEESLEKFGAPELGSVIKQLEEIEEA
ncbi:MAG: hypothetical protein R3321_15060, partial [Nitrososphaeraceae archaeon]|nr:hypothetical protein [Nitrososphaeraceae archaeon]